MPRSEGQLDKAYYLIGEGYLNDAAYVLDAVIEADPHNIEAWELYFQISDGRGSLETLAKRVQGNPELNQTEKKEILAYQEYVWNRLSTAPEVLGQEQSPAGSRSALTILGGILAVVIALWAMVPEVRSMVAVYFLIAFILGLAYWFWRSDQTVDWSGSRSFSYGVSTPHLRDADKPELFFYEPIIKVGPAPEDDR